MKPWRHLPLRARVALAFALVTAGAMAGLGTFLHLRVGAVLEEQTRTTLAARLEALERLPEAERADVVRDLTGESFGQLLDVDGRVLTSSPELRGPLVGPGRFPPDGGTATFETTVFLAGEGEQTPAMLRLSRSSSGVMVVGTATEDSEEVLEGLRTQLLVGGPLALLLAAVLGYGVAGAALRPLERMRARAATISARSSGERLPLPEVRDEVHRLGATLNTMLDRLDSGLRRERQFVAEASHELRTPLALLRTELDLAAARPRTPEEMATFLDSATEEVDRLSALVDQLLLLAAADEGRLELDLARVDLTRLLHDVAARFEPLAGGRRLRVEPGPTVEAMADRRRLDQAVSNLVENAIRHGSGPVRLGAARLGDVVEITVADEGGVILGEELFERFRRGEGPRTGGRGLGLAIVRTIVTEHGGRVDPVTDAGITTVRIRIPADPRAAEE